MGHYDNGHFSALEEVDEKLLLPEWDSKPAAMTVGCPSGAAQRRGYDLEDLQGQLKALCCSFPLVKSCQSHYRCCYWCCGFAGHRCLGHGKHGREPLRCCLPCPGKGQKQTGGEAESWVGIPSSHLCLGQGYTQSQTSWQHPDGPEEVTVTESLS